MRENFSQDGGIEEPYWGPSQSGNTSFDFCNNQVLQEWVISLLPKHNQEDQAAFFVWPLPFDRSSMVRLKSQLPHAALWVTETWELHNHGKQSAQGAQGIKGLSCSIFKSKLPLTSPPAQNERSPVPLIITNLTAGSTSHFCEINGVCN